MMMKAYQVVEFGKPVALRDVEIPKPGDYEVLAKTLMTGVCHTDLHVIQGDLGHVPLPITPGHEGVGIVEEVGSKVTKFKPGDRIGVPWLGESCLNCPLCKAGQQNLCKKQHQTGYLRHGSFAEYFVADERFSARIPANISDAAVAPILCAGLTAYKALRLADVKEGDRVVISGACGGLGHLAIQYAKVMKYEVVALDIMDESKAQFMKEIGADFTVNLRDKSKTLAEQMESLSGSDKNPVRASVVFAPVLGAVSDAVDYVAPGGTIVCVGLPAGKYEIDVATFILKQLRLQGSIVGTPSELEEALQIASKGSVSAHVEVKEFSALNDVLADMEAGKLKGRVVLRVNSGVLRN